MLFVRRFSTFCKRMDHSVVVTLIRYLLDEESVWRD
jgi:hypothetical protein